ncbi:MAG: DNA cytosine methyltransferase [Myxococcales bacterium]|nr:DNA cytosine methyltransferase [Myxococcales bacterium]
MPQTFNFVDLFAGAGGFSEGFLQASTVESAFKFLLASDINENCELTHQVRYNEQLGLGITFVCKSIKDPDFVDVLLDGLRDPATGAVRPVDVICGGPPCQSFSLAGRRRLHDKKDDLFAHYLKVIATLRPKYFIMENVTGILTKDDGKHRERILREIASIIDPDVIPRARDLAARVAAATTTVDRAVAGLVAEGLSDLDRRTYSAQGVRVAASLSAQFRAGCAALFTYKTSKTDKDVLTVRHALAMLERRAELQSLRDRITQLKGACDLDRDYIVDDFDAFLSVIEPEELIERAEQSLDRLVVASKDADAMLAVRAGLSIAAASTSELLSKLAALAKGTPLEREAAQLAASAALYQINEPLVLNAADFGVPQERRRVFFIGCRKGLPFIQSVQPTVPPDQRVTVFEALWDLDFVGGDEHATDYAKESALRSGPEWKQHGHLVRPRSPDGLIAADGKDYATRSREGRIVAGKARYASHSGAAREERALQNHKTSRHNTKVVDRMRMMQAAGGWDNVSKEALATDGLESAKRDYAVLVREGQSPTVMTIADDFVHYRVPRTLTVREMARLQSFDDSFVFQGKRTTGGDRRKDEVPQFTLVGNAVPPLLARAVAATIRGALERSETEPPATAKRSAKKAGRGG